MGWRRGRAAWRRLATTESLSPSDPPGTFLTLRYVMGAVPHSAVALLIRRGSSGASLWLIQGLRHVFVMVSSQGIISYTHSVWVHAKMGAHNVVFGCGTSRLCVVQFLWLYVPSLFGVGGLPA
jgi:hypothetical protein